MAGLPEGRRIDATADDALGAGDVTDLLARLARREVSPGELRAAALARAAVVNPALNALVDLFEEPVRPEVAVRTDAPLAGIPTLVKDNEEVVGHRTTHASWALPDRPAPHSAPFVADMIALGLDPLGSTTLPEFAMTASTESLRFGPTRNPWDTDRSAGGSSGGSAALVAAGVVPIAHANDGGGSIRIPAACCGLVGLKPTRGRLRDNPALRRFPLNIWAEGVLTRSVRDTALFLAALERNRPAAGLPHIGAVTHPSDRRLRIGVSVTAGRGLPVGEEVVAAARQVGALCAGLGHHVEEIPALAEDGFLPAFLDYWAFLAFSIHRVGPALLGPGFDASRLGPFVTGLSARASLHADRMPRSLRRLRRLAREREPAFARHDVLLTPVTGHGAPQIGLLGPTVPFRTHLARLLRFASFTALHNVTGSPALSLPLGRTADGFPLGVQLVAPFGRERRLLGLGLELEAAGLRGRRGAAANQPRPRSEGWARSPTGRG